MTRNAEAYDAPATRATNGDRRRAKTTDIGSEQLQVASHTPLGELQSGGRSETQYMNGDKYLLTSSRGTLMQDNGLESAKHTLMLCHSYAYFTVWQLRHGFRNYGNNWWCNTIVLTQQRWQ